MDRVLEAQSRLVKFRSIIETTGTTTFPEYRGERIYMREFLKSEGLPIDLARWQPTVDAMLKDVNTTLPVYLMVDESFVVAGQAQRRRGLHIDGYWNPGISAHGGAGGSSHAPRPPGHGSFSIVGNHGSVHRGHNSRPTEPSGHNSVPVSRHSSGAVTWQHADFSAPEGVILASTVSAARGFVGDFDGPIGEGGDCSSFDLTGLRTVPMVAHVIYAGNVTALHESLPVDQDCYRQLARLNVPGWTP